MIEVEVPGKGVVEFPDGMNPRDMEHAVFQAFPDLIDTPQKQRKADLLAARSEALYGPTMSEYQKAVGEGLEESLMKPFVPIPRPGKLASPTGPQDTASQTALRSVDVAFEKLIGAAEAIETPLTVAMVASGAVVPRTMAAVAGLMGAGQVTTGASEVVEGVKKGDVPTVVGGTVDAALGGLMIGGSKSILANTKTALDTKVAPVAPASAEAAKATVDLVKPVEMAKAVEAEPVKTAPLTESEKAGVQADLAAELGDVAMEPAKPVEAAPAPINEGQPGIRTEAEVTETKPSQLSWDLQATIQRAPDGTYEWIEQGKVLDRSTDPMELVQGFHEDNAGYSTRVRQISRDKFELDLAEPLDPENPIHELYPIGKPVSKSPKLATGATPESPAPAASLPAPTSPPAQSTPIGIVPSGVAKSAERAAGEALIDQERIKTKAPVKDVAPQRDIISSPEFEFRNIPEAKRIVTAGVEANLAYKSKVAHTVQQLDAFKQTLHPAEQIQLTKALFEKEADASSKAIEALPPQVKEAAKAIRQTYDSIRQRVIADKKSSVENELSGPQMNALRQVQDGMSLDEAARANGLREAGKSIVESAAKELKELDSWGIKEYTTHIERGSYRVETPDGTTIAIGETRAAAALKADRWLKENPDVKSVTITDEFDPGVEFPTKLSQGQYFRLVKRLEDNLGESAKEIQNLLHKNGSIVAVKPTNKYAAPLQRRRNILKGEENVFDVLPTYVHIMEKKLALDPVLREVRNKSKSLPPRAAKQLESWANDLKGSKSPENEIADWLMKPFGIEPFVYSRSLERIRNLTTHLKLGYRPVSAIVNRISGLQHTWTKVGTKYLVEGRKFMNTPEGRALIDENKPYLGIEAAFVHEKLRPTSEEPLYKPLGMFQAAEKVNRPEAFAAHYKFAEGELGLKGQEAVEYAKGATRFGQFVYDSASLGRAFRNPTGRFMLQFKPYLVKELEFISSLRGPEIARYMAGFLAVGGPRAAIVTLKSLPIVGLAIGLDKLEDVLNQTFPTASRGVPGLLGVDVSPAVAFQFPTTVPELLGPTVSDIYKLYSDVISPVIQGEDRDMKDVASWAFKLAPALNYWGQLVEAVASENGWITDKRGRLAYQPSKSDYVKLALGAKPLNKSIQEVETQFLRKTEQVDRANRQRLIDDYLDAVEKDDGSEVKRLGDKVAEAGITTDAIRGAARNRGLEPKLRLFKSLSRKRRGEEIERFEEKP